MTPQGYVKQQAWLIRCDRSITNNRFVGERRDGTPITSLAALVLGATETAQVEAKV